MHKGSKNLGIIYLFSLWQPRITVTESTRLDAVLRFVGDDNVGKVVFAATGPPTTAGEDEKCEARYEALTDKLTSQSQLTQCDLIRLNGPDTSIQPLLDALADTGKRDSDNVEENRFRVGSWPT
jgi:hypothetical protein